MKYMKIIFKELSLSDEGVVAVEYAIMASLIAAIIAGSVSLLGGTVLNLFSSVQFP